MYVIVWRYEVAGGREPEFERIYGPEGDWAVLFRSSPGFVRTELYRDASGPSAYLTFDYWSDQAAFEEFRESAREAYEALDSRTEALTLREERMGTIRE